MNGVDLVAESERERTAAAIREVFESGHARLEAPLLTKDGTTIPYQFAANAVEHPSGELRLVGVGRDVTDHREYESQLERQNERLEEFASVVSHDLRNPLNVAVGQLELARGDCESEHLDTVASALDRIDEIIESSLTLAREGSTIEEPEPVDVSDLARRCWTTVDTGAATLRVPETVRVEADESRLRNVIENLMQNAVKYGGEDVTVTVGSLDGGFTSPTTAPASPRTSARESSRRVRHSATGRVWDSPSSSASRRPTAGR
jgi:signal transduction histidine kinase